MARHGKKYREVAQKVDQSRLYTPDEAIALVRETSYVKFDPTVEVHLRLGIDPRHADQNIRTTVALPHGTGKRVRVLVFAQGEADPRREREPGSSPRRGEAGRGSERREWHIPYEPWLATS
jgi:large subunit ribosomal protein L1